MTENNYSYNSYNMVNGIQDVLNSLNSCETQTPPTIPTGRPTIPTGNAFNNNKIPPMPPTPPNPFEVTTGKNTLWGFNALSIPKNENGKSYYILCCIIDKSDSTVQDVQNAIINAQNAGQKKFGQNFIFSTPLKDGDQNPPKSAQSGAFNGKYYLYARNNQRPIIIDDKGELLQDNSTVHVHRFYSNCYGPVSIEFCPYCFDGKTGISCKLKHLLFLGCNSGANALTGVNAQNAAINVFSQYLH